MRAWFPVSTCLVALIGAAAAGALSGSGTITTVAGTGKLGFSGDGGAATSAELSHPIGVTVDSKGDFFIADTENNRVREVSGGVITTVAGGGAGASLGDGGSATSGRLRMPVGVAVDRQGDLYIADWRNYRIREVSGGVISTVAGGGTSLSDGGPATSARLLKPLAIAVDPRGDIYIADAGDNRVREVHDGVITTVAGKGPSGQAGCGYSGDGGSATAASLCYPLAVAVDGRGNLFIADSANRRVREVSGGIITTVAGNGQGGFSGDGGPATSAAIDQPAGITVDSQGNLYIVDRTNNRVREVAGGVIRTIAGSGLSPPRCGSSGDGGSATSARLCLPTAIATDARGDLYITDTTNNRVREVTKSQPAKLKAGQAVVGKAVAGKAVTVSVTVTDAQTGRGVKGNVSCSAKLAGTVIVASRSSSTLAGLAACTWQLPKTASGKRLNGSIAVGYEGARATRRFLTVVR